MEQLGFLQKDVPLPLSQAILGRPEVAAGKNADRTPRSARNFSGMRRKVVFAGRQIVPYAFTTSLFVEGSHPEASYRRDVRHAIGFSLAQIALGILSAVGLGRWVLGFFGSAYSAAGYEPLVLLSLASPVILANNVFATDLRVAKRIRPLFGITFVVSAVVLLLAFALLPVWGIGGAAGHSHWDKHSPLPCSPAKGAATARQVASYPRSERRIERARSWVVCSVQNTSRRFRGMAASEWALGPRSRGRKVHPRRRVTLQKVESRTRPEMNASAPKGARTYAIRNP